MPSSLYATRTHPHNLIIQVVLVYQKVCYAKVF